MKKVYNLWAWYLENLFKYKNKNAAIFVAAYLFILSLLRRRHRINNSNILSNLPDVSPNVILNSSY